MPARSVDWSIRFHLQCAADQLGRGDRRRATSHRDSLARLVDHMSAEQREQFDALAEAVR